MEDNPDVENKFIGRARFLQSLLEIWSRNRMVAVFGQKSVGKSRTVKEFLKRLQNNDDESDLKIIYVDLQGITSMQALRFKTLVSLEFIDEILEDADDWVVQMCDRINDDSVGAYILSFDNAEYCLNSPVRQDYITTCKTIIEKCDKVRIIFSSTTMVTTGFRLFMWQELPPMDTADGCHLVKSIAPLVHFGRTLEKIVELCCGLPLALNIAASELNEESSLLTPEDMVEILSQCRVKALSNESYVQDEQIEFVYCKFIRQLTKEFQQRLAILGYIPGSFQAAQASHLLVDSSVSETKSQTLSPLMKRHMMKFEPKTMRYDIHAILQDCLAVYFQIENLPEIRKRYCRTFSAVMCELSLKMDTEEYLEAYAVFSQEQINLKKLLTDVIHSEQETFPFYIQMASSCTNLIMNYFGNESILFFTKCFDLAKMYGKDRDRALAMTYYGRAMTNVKGDYSEGRHMLTMAVHIIEKIEPASESLASSQSGLDSPPAGQFDRGVEVITKAGCEESRIMRSLLNCLGLAYKQDGQFILAEKYMFGALNKCNKKGNYNPSSAGLIYNNIGTLFSKKRDYENAYKYFSIGLKIKQESKAPLNSVISSQNNIAGAYVYLGRYDEAKAILEDAMNSLEKVPDLYPAERSQTLDTIGLMYWKQGNYSDAIINYKTAVDIRRTRFSGGIPLIKSLISLGGVYKDAQVLPKALRTFQEALGHNSHVYEQKADVPKIYDCYLGIIDIFTQMGDTERLEEAFEGAAAQLTTLIAMYEANDVHMSANEFKVKLEDLKKVKNANPLLSNGDKN